MATVKRLNTRLAHLRELGERYTEARTKLEEASRERDRAIVAATRGGASRRQVAAAAGVTVGRVQQILQELDER